MQPERARNPLPSPVRTNKLSIYLKDHPDTATAAEIIAGFTHGFPIPSSLTYRSATPPNHKSTLDNPYIVSQKIESELAAGRISGPHHQPPLPNFICSPLGLVPKKTPGQHRIIHDLSYPKGNSVNSHVPPGQSAVTYELLDNAIAIIQIIGHGALVAKADIESAFRLIPLHPSSYHLTGFTWQGQYYYDKVLPFGASTSCRTFELFSTSLQWILQHHMQVPYISHIIDDFMFFGPANDPTCRRSLAKFMILAEDLAIPVKKEKTIRPCTQLELHGILVDTVAWTMSLPQDKTTNALASLRTLYKRRSVTLKELQSLIGTLNFATKVVLPGRAFLRRLIDLTVGIHNQNRHIDLKSPAKADMLAWIQFLEKFNGTHLFPAPDWSSPDALKLQVATSTHGFATIMGQEWFRGDWPADWATQPQVVKDLFPITTAFQLWSSRLANMKLLILCPSLSASHAINNTTSKLKPAMTLIRSLVVSNMLHNIQVHAIVSPNYRSKLAINLSLQEPTTTPPPGLNKETTLPDHLQPYAIPLPAS